MPVTKGRVLKVVKDPGCGCNSLSASRLKLYSWDKYIPFEAVYLGKESELL
jgi:hypothetical protein